MFAKIALYFSCAYIAFVSGAGFLFGQAFAGQFSFGATLAGVSGIASGILAILARELIRKKTLLTLVACVACLVGVLLDVRDYYVKDHSEGNYYAWFMIGPYLFGLLMLILGEILRWGYPPGPPPLPNDQSFSSE